MRWSADGSRLVNYYDIWFNLKDPHRDLELVANVNTYLGHLQRLGKVGGYRLRRRKLGFGPPELGEFHLSIWTESLAQLDAAFDVVATRSGEVEQIHSRVYSMVTDFRSALYRDFPDPQRDGGT